MRIAALHARTGEIDEKTEDSLLQYALCRGRRNRPNAMQLSSRSGRRTLEHEAHCHGIGRPNEVKVGATNKELSVVQFYHCLGTSIRVSHLQYNF